MDSNMLTHSQFNIKPDPWLSTIMEVEVYSLTFLKTGARCDSPGIDSIINQIKLKHSPFFIYSKVSTTNLDLCNQFEEKGFRLVDTSIQFAKQIMPSKPKQYIRFVVPEDEAEVVSLAKKSFYFSRFHLDPLIKAETANLIKAEWVRNYFHGKRGENMIIAEANNQVVGFLQLLYKDGDVLVIDLIAVKENARGKNIAASMINYAQGIKGFKKMIVGTQVANTPSIRLYSKLGFEQVESSYIFHLHSR